MLCEWSVECGADDPVLVVPWSDPAHPDRHFIDLRENPYDLDHLPEAELYPPLMHALRALNAPRSVVFTAKCDAWALDFAKDGEELERLRLELDQILEDTPAGFASYIDILWRERSTFASFHQHEQLLHRLTRQAAPLDHPHALLDCVLRPALIDITVAHEGFALSLYVKALGHDLPTAEEHWAAALNDVVAVLRGRAFSLP
ncbi:MAG TPA: hypothetical protein VIX90_03155 [Edaphobacter sp.]